MPADESIRTLSVTAASTAASRRLIHCSLRRASSRLRILRRWRSGSTAAAISRRRRVKVEGAPPRIRIAMVAGCTCPAATAWYSLELGVAHSGAYAGGEVTDDADDLVPAPGLHILRRGASAPVDIADAPAEGVAAENPLGERLVDHDRSAFGRLRWAGACGSNICRFEPAARQDRNVEGAEEVDIHAVKPHLVDVPIVRAARSDCDARHPVSRSTRRVRRRD